MSKRIYIRSYGTICPASWTVTNDTFPAVNPLPPLERTVPATLPPSRVIHGIVFAVVNSLWNLVSSASTQRSLPWENSELWIKKEFEAYDEITHHKGFLDTRLVTNCIRSTHRHSQRRPKVGHHHLLDPEAVMRYCVPRLLVKQILGLLPYYRLGIR